MKKILLLFSYILSFSLNSCGGGSSPTPTPEPTPTPTPTGVFNVTWKNYDGSALLNETYNYGDMPLYKGVTPTKPETKEHKYVFSSWTPNIEKVICNKAYTALFSEANTVSLTCSLTTEGTVSGSGTYVCGSGVNISATPNKGYSFDGWYDGSSCISTSTSYTFTMPNHDISYNAVFKANNYNVSLTASPVIGGTISGSGAYAYGSSVNILASPSNGYKFDGWYKDGSFVSSEASYAFTMPANNVSYEARFVVKSYTVTVTSEDTSKGTVSGSGPYDYGSSVNITATPKDGYSFEGWYKDGEKVPSASASYTFTMPANDVSYEARFTANQYTVTLATSPSGGGTVSGGGPHAYGESVTINATPKTGYSFEGWYKDGSKVKSSTSYTFTMPANNVSYEARFSANQYTVTLNASPIEGGTVTGSGPHAYNSSVTIKATPKDGCSFEGWYKDGEKVPSASASYTFTMPANDVSYEARFISSENMWYLKSDWWNYCSNGEDGVQATASDIGREVNLTVNGQIHRVRLIDVNHDILSEDASKTAHCTFEFSNLLSDSSGYSLATFWNTSNGKGSTNYDYLNSDLRKALDNQGTGALRWYQKEAKTKSTDSNYTKPVIEMLPSELKNNIKTVKKQVATTYSYDIKYYDAKVFALTYKEMTTESDSHTKAEGTTYQYYKDHYDKSSRIKSQIKWHVGAVTDYTKITDLGWNPYNYAGYNSSKDSNGGYYWLTSPNTHFSCSEVAWDVDDDGKLGITSYDVCRYAFAVAPAFCI